MSEKDIRAEMAAAISNAIINHGTDAGDGETAIDPEQARQALVISLAMILEADPRSQTARGLREMTERAIGELKMQTKRFRRTFETTGNRGWDARPVTYS